MVLKDGQIIRLIENKRWYLNNGRSKDYKPGSLWRFTGYFNQESFDLDLINVENLLNSGEAANGCSTSCFEEL